MAHLHRFYIAPELIDETVIALSSTEAHHAIHVVRLREGDEAVLFDGQGRESEAVVCRLTRREAELTVRETRVYPKPPLGLTLVQAWLQREKCIEELIRRCTEIGVTRFRFFQAERSGASLRVREKWQRWAIDSCKQCGRVWLPDFEIAPSLESALDGLDEGPVLMATTDRGPSTPLRVALDGTTQASVVVGPEGDFSPAELDTARDRGLAPIRLGEVTLRAEVAAITASTLIAYELGGLGPLETEESQPYERSR